LKWDGLTEAEKFSTELETTIQRGTTYRVIDVKRTVESNGLFHTNVYLEVVAQDENKVPK